MSSIVRYALIISSVLIPVGSFQTDTFQGTEIEGTGGGVDVPLGPSNEPTIAVNPLDPNNIAVASNDRGSTSIRVSTDGGATFSAST